MPNDQTIVITGAGGFLAGFAARAFRESGWTVHGISRRDPRSQTQLFDSFTIDDLSNTSSLTPLLTNLRPHVVLHLAGPANVGDSQSDPIGDLQRQLLPTARLLDSIRQAGGATRVLLLSSAAVYGQPAQTPVSPSAPLAPISPYGFHKVMQEMLCDEYRLLFGVPSCKARVFSTFGEGMQQLAVWDIARRALNGDLAVLGTGEEIRDYLYAGEVGRALVAIAERSSFDGEAVNVGSGQGLIIRELASEIFHALGIDEQPRFTGSVAAGNPSRWIADVSSLRTLGFTPREPFAASLQKTVHWIRDDA